MSTSHLKPPSGSVHDIQLTPDLDITIRFSASLPDLLLSVFTTKNATTSTLKQLIRASLPIELKDRRIRLIHAGKALVDDALLSVTFKRQITQPPSRTATPGPYSSGARAATDHNGNGKGKEVIRDPPQTLHRIYIHCSIGDIVLTSAELDAENALANFNSAGTGKSGDNLQETSDEAVSDSTPAPRGFDRLLTAGFTAAEVQSLRLQFMDIQAHVHTPDTMPSPGTLRDMEDRWLDNGNNASGSGMAGSGGGMADDDAHAGSLDDMLWGAAMGFLWPMGCLFWGAREEGIWSQRRRMAAVVGIVLNLGIGLIRYTS